MRLQNIALISGILAELLRFQASQITVIAFIYKLISSFS